MSRSINIVGNKYNHLTVIEELPARKMNDGRDYLFVKAICDCGNSREFRKSAIKSLRIKYCSNECPIKMEDYSVIPLGGKVGNLKLVGFIGFVGNGGSLVGKFKCKCGSLTEKSISNVKNNHISNCSISCVRRQDQKFVGSKFGKLTVIEVLRYPKNPPKAVCECECGATVERSLYNLKRNSKSGISCGCTFKRDLTNEKFGNLTVIRELPQTRKLYKGKRKSKNTYRNWLCKCSCGNEVETTQSSLLNEGKSHCGQYCEILTRKKSTSLKGAQNPMYGKRAELHPGWNPSITREERIRGRKYIEYTLWRQKVYGRDAHTCKCCGVKGNGKNLVAHHLDGYNWCLDKRLDTDNGVTLCKDCHEEFHDTYGRGNNTTHQFIQWFEANRQRFDLSQERFDSLIAWLASANAMSVEEYRDYVYHCHENPRTINELKEEPQ